MNDHPAWFSSRGLQALALALLTGLTASGPTRAEDVQVNITADNAYAFGFGSRDEIESFFGGVQNCSSGAIFFQPESYTIPNAAPEDYLYIIAWSDDSTTQGVLGAFSTAAGSVYTGAGNWEVFATGINLDPPIGNACVTGPAANTPSLGSLNAQIAIANQNAGNASTTSRGWVGPTGGAGVGEVAFGEANDTAPGIFPQVPAISQQAHWMWYNRDPQSITNPFNTGNHREYLIFRLPLIQIPGVDSCVRTIRETAFCAADGTGDFLYTLTFRNNSGKSVHHLFFVDPQNLTNPNSTVSIVPDSISFASSPVPPSGLRKVDIRIKGASPQDKIQFVISLQDDFTDECCQGCQTRKTIDLPPCNCAQVTGGAGLQCRFWSFDTYTYSLELQSLIADPIHYLLLAPASGSAGTFTPASLKLAPPLGQFQKRSFSTILGKATPGAKLCTQIGLFGEGFKDCCAIERCETVPRCILGPDDVTFNGDVSFQVTDFGLLVTGFGTSGEDGISIDTGKALGWDGEWLPIEANSLPDGALLRNTFRGEVEGASGTIAVLESRKTAAGVELRTDLSGVGATTQRIEFFNDGELVGFETGHENGEPLQLPNVGGGKGRRFHTDAHFRLLESVPASQENATPCNPNEFTLKLCLFAGYTFKEAYVFDRFGPVTEVRFYPEDATVEATALEEVAIQAARIPSLTLVHVNAELDCNENGIPDSEDIAVGSSADLNTNGIPDECEGGAGDLELSLNTGFDETTGTTLPPGSLPNGTADDDWRVVNTGTPGPARLVIKRKKAWPAPLADSQWISVNPDQGKSINTQQVQFENCFCLAGTATTADLALQLRADDEAAVFLNGQAIGGPGGGFRGAPLAIHLSGAVGGNGPFRAGENCLRVEVNDSGGVVTGLDLTGTVRALNGLCAN